MKFFVLGCGSIGRRYVRNLVSLGLCDIVVYDVNPNVMSSIAEEYQLSTVGSISKGLAQHPEVSIICLPPHLHIAAAIEAAEAGSHLLIEKPLDMQLERVEELTELIKNHDLVDFVSCNFRFDEGMKRIKQGLEDGMIGKPLSLRATFGFFLPDWRPDSDYRMNYASKALTGGGVILDRIHEFDYVIWLLGEARYKGGFAGRVGPLEIETEDLADIVLMHQAGTISTIHIDYLRRDYLCACEISGEEGILIWDFKKRSVLHFDASNKTWRDVSVGIPPDTNSMYVDQLRHFIESVRNNVSTVNPVFEAAKILKFVLEIRKALFG